jgi:DNA replication protein DnaC
MADIAALSGEERCGLWVDRALTERDTRRLTTRVRQATRRQTAGIEALDDRHPRGLDKAWITRLATCQWVRAHHPVLSTGPTGSGNTWRGCALGHQACRDGCTARSRRLPRFLPARPIAQGDGRDGKRRATLARIDGLMLEDWGLAPFSDDPRRALLEIIADRHECRAPLVTRP